LAADLKQRFDVDSELKPGRGGVFDVEVDGERIYSKEETHRFPHPGEVDEAIARLLKRAKKS
jgi:selT/selW/selH-like putative selenoprotein